MYPGIIVRNFSHLLGSRGVVFEYTHTYTHTHTYTNNWMFLGPHLPEWYWHTDPGTAHSDLASKPKALLDKAALEQTRGRVTADTRRS